MASAVRDLRRDLRRAAAHEWRAQRWVWLLPLVAGWLVRREPVKQVSALSGALLGIGIVLFLAARPAKALLALVALLPFHTAIFSFLLRLGLPSTLVRLGGFWKELIIVGLVLAALRKAIQEGHKPDKLDIAAFIYMVSTGLYVLIPGLFIHGGGWPRIYVRFLDWKSMELYVILLLAVRHLRFPREMLDRLARTVLATGGIVAGIGIFEFLRSGSWNSFVVKTLQAPRYETIILKSPFAFPNPTDIRWWSYAAGHRVVRVGSVLMSPLYLGFYLVVVFAIGLERITRGKAGAWTYMATVASAFALLFTQTRSALIAGGLVLVLALRRLPGRSANARARVALLLVGAIIVVTPIAVSSGAISRAVNGDTKSNSGHSAGLHTGLYVVTHHPLGLGLGTSPDIGDRFEVQNTTTSEDYYLQVANTVGVLNLALFAILLLTLIALTQRSVLPGRDAALGGGVAGAIIGLSVSGFFLHSWATPAMSWTLWSLAAVVISTGQDWPEEDMPIESPDQLPLRHRW